MKQKHNTQSVIRLAILIPTYNEASNITLLLERLQAVSNDQPELQILACIIDDSSPDGTAKIAKIKLQELATDTFNGFVLRRKSKEGLGKAYSHGFDHIIKQFPNFDYIMQMDADLSHDPVYIPGFIAAARTNKAKLVIGSRYVSGGGVQNWEFRRKLLSRVANHYATMVLGKSIKDYTGGYNLYAMSCIRDLLHSGGVTSDGYSFQIELKYKIAHLTSEITELPITFIGRIAGESKIPSNTALKTLLLVAALPFQL